MKTYNTQYGIGKSKYVVNYHDGVKKHKDGSPFFDIAIFKNAERFHGFICGLIDNGYKLNGGLQTAEEEYPELDNIATWIYEQTMRLIVDEHPKVKSKCPYKPQCILEMVIKKLEEAV